MINYIKASIRKIKVLTRLHKNLITAYNKGEYDKGLNIIKRIERVKYTI